jgi:hypothetical protein
MKCSIADTEEWLKANSIRRKTAEIAVMLVCWWVAYSLPKILPGVKVEHGSVLMCLYASLVVAAMWSLARDCLRGKVTAWYAALAVVPLGVGLEMGIERAFGF